MKKLGVLLYGIGLLGISLYGLSNNSYYIQIFINLSKPYMLVRSLLIMVLAAYTFVPQLRLYVTRALLSIGGIMLMALGLISLASPTLLGHGNSYILLGDSLTLIEGGILAIVLSAELSARRSRFMARSFLYIKSQLATRPRELTHSPLQPVKILKAQS